jgi:hypothetical protein
MGTRVAVESGLSGVAMESGCCVQRSDDAATTSG